MSTERELLRRWQRDIKDRCHTPTAMAIEMSDQLNGNVKGPAYIRNVLGVKSGKATELSGQQLGVFQHWIEQECIKAGVHLRRKAEKAE